MVAIASRAPSTGVVTLPGRTPLLDRQIEIPNTQEGIEELQARLIKEGVPSGRAEGPDTRTLYARLKSFFESVLFGSNVKEALMLACIAFHPDTPSDKAMEASEKLIKIAPEVSALMGVELKVSGDKAELSLSLDCPPGESAQVGDSGQVGESGQVGDALKKDIPCDTRGKQQQRSLLKLYDKVVNEVPNSMRELNEEALAKLGPSVQTTARAQHARAQAEHDKAVTQRFMDGWVNSLQYTPRAGEYTISLEGRGGAGPFHSPEAAAAATPAQGSIKVASPEEVCLYFGDLLDLDTAAREARGVNLTRDQAHHALLLLQVDMMTPMMANDFTFVRHPQAEQTPVQRFVTQSGTNLVVTIKTSSILPASVAATEHSPRQVEYTQRWTIGPEKDNVHCTTNVDSVLGDWTRGIKRLVV